MGIKFETPITKSETKETSNFFDFLNKDINLFGNSFSNKKKENFYARLGILLKSGISLNKALELIAESQKKEKNQVLILGLSKQIVAGESLYEVLKANSNFSPYEYQAIKIGEQTGKLYNISNDLFLFFRQKNEQKRQVYSALSYPLIILFTALIVVYFMMQFVVPMFVDIFKQNKVDLPWITQMIVDLSNFITSYGGYLFLLLFTLPFILRYLKKQAWYRRRLDSLKLKIPVIGSYLKKVYVTQFVQAMALLTNAKVPMVNSLSLAQEMIPFYPLQSSLKEIGSNIIKGEKLSDNFANYSLFDKDMIALLKVAEETNQTEFVFQKLFEQYSDDLKYSSQIITSVLNPIFILLVSLIVGVILIAMYLPMFKLSSVIG